MKNFKNTIAILFALIPFYGIAQVKTDTAKPVTNGFHQASVSSGPKDTTKPMAIVVPAIPFPDTSVHVYEQPVVKNTVQKIYDYQRYNHGTSPGFRVQIDFSQERNTANTTKLNFAGKYPGIPSYITYKQPYFRVSVGDFRTHLEAVRCLNAVKRDYQAAFIVADRISPPPLQ